MRYIFKLIFSSIISLSVLQAQAQIEAPTFYLGAHAGFSDASGPTTGKEAQVSYGARLGWLFYEHVALGVFTYFMQSNQTRESIGYVPLLAEVTFYPYGSPLESSALFVSAYFGTTKIVYDQGLNQGTNNQTTFGVGGGYLFFIEPRYSLGPEFQYLFIFDNEKYALWSVLATLKVWF